MRTLTRATLVLVLLALTSACAPARGIPAPAPAMSTAASASADSAWVSDALYFGMDKPAGGTISDAEWEAFLRDVVTPRFPAGLTVSTARGQWRGADGVVAREESHVVQVFHAPSAAADSAVAEIAAEYKRRFGQEAVMRVRSRAQVSF
ncbi:MAG: hypothetical protein JWM27_1277 [Gemmatimonadetes bacterium]|nr:hypothetical protein [Gemmatimonadota bacterium]